MREYLPARGMRRVMLLFLGVALLGMACVSLGQRLMRPELVVPSDARQFTAGGDAPGDAPADAQDEIGQLMQKVQQNPGDVAALLHLAEHFVQDQNWQAAENFLRKATVAAPSEPQALYLLGVALHNQGKHVEAAACLERVVSLRDEASVRYSLGVLYVHYLQDPARGGRHLRTALAQPALSADLASLIQAELDALAPKETPPKDVPGKKGKEVRPRSNAK